MAGQQPEVRKSEIVDVTSFPLASQEHWETTDVAESMRHVLDGLERSAESISGWSSFIEDGSGE